MKLNGEDYEYTAEDIDIEIQDEVDDITALAGKTYKEAKKEIRDFETYFKIGQKAGWQDTKTGLISKQSVEFSRINNEAGFPEKIIISDKKDGILAQYSLKDKNNFVVVDYTEFPKLKETEIMNGEPVRRTIWKDKNPEEITFEYGEDDTFVYKETHYNRRNNEVIYDKVLYANPNDNSDCEYIEFNKESDFYNSYIISEVTGMWTFDRATAGFPYEEINI